MSSRALRRLREEKEQREASIQDTIDEEDEEEHGVGDGNGGGKGKAFLMMMDSSSSEEQEEESDDEDESDDDGTGDEAAAAAAAASAPATSKGDEEMNDEEEEEEDFDAILSEFRQPESHSSRGKAAGEKDRSSVATTARSVLLGSFDPRDLDLDYTMRTLLGGDAAAVAPDPPVQPRGRVNRRAPARRTVLGKSRPEWGRAPPNYVGGGLGMKELTDEEREKERHSWKIPWPYCCDDGDDDRKPPADGDGESEDSTSASRRWSNARWHTFHPSDTYYHQSIEFRDLTQVADPNALALFVADNPYFADAALQLSMVLFHVNDRERGNELLKRALWVYESACLGGFLPGTGVGGGASAAEGPDVLMDHERMSNGGFFSALFHLMQTSSMAGCVSTSLAVSRFLLSLDPLRDPMGVLLTMDYFALATLWDEHARFVVDLVESKTIQIFHKEAGTDEHHCCDLIDLPNWSYSYALALSRLSHNDEAREGAASIGDDDSLSGRADEALRSALRQFPSVLSLLLEANNVDIRGRSFQMDWPSVLARFRHLVTRSMEGSGAEGMRGGRDARDHVVKIFVQRSHKLWGGDDVLRWLYDNAAALAKAEVDGDKTSDSVPSPPSPALVRYMRCDPSDYEDAFRTLPAEANPLDPALVAPAMALDPNRRRLLRRGGRGVRGGDAGDVEWQMRMLEQRIGPGGEMVVVDPDSPMLEVFWRSLMPWARVDGVPPPQR